VRKFYAIRVRVFLTHPRAKFQSQGNKCPLVYAINQGLEMFIYGPKN